MEPKVVQPFPTDQLICDPQIRETFTEESLFGMAQSVKENGILQPLLVRRNGSKFIVLDGERRLRAAKKAGLATIPVIVDDRELSEPEVVTRQLICNAQREDLTPLEKARAIERLMRGTQLSATQVAAKLGMSNATISRLLALLSLPDEIRQQVETGKVPASTAYELARVSDAQQQAQLAKQVASGQLTREQLAQQKRRRAPRKPAPVEHVIRITAALGAGRPVTIGGPSKSLDDFIKLLNDLLAKAREVREQNRDLLAFVNLFRAKGNTA